jgi:hypothetical protein
MHPGVPEIAEGIQGRGAMTAKTARVHAIISAPTLIEDWLHAGDDAKSSALRDTSRTHRLSVLNSMTLAAYEIKPMIRGSARIGINNSLSRSITDGMKRSLLAGAHTEIYVLSECFTIDELPTTGVRRIEIRLAQTGSVRTQGTVDEQVSPGATSTESIRNFDTALLCKLTPVGDNAGAAHFAC